MTLTFHLHGKADTEDDDVGQQIPRNWILVDKPVTKINIQTVCNCSTSRTAASRDIAKKHNGQQIHASSNNTKTEPKTSGDYRKNTPEEDGIALALLSVATICFSI